MREVYAVFKDEEKKYATGPFEPLVLDLVQGLSDIASNVYKDEFLSVELDDNRIRVLRKPKNVMVICVSKNDCEHQMEFLYRVYGVCKAYENFGLMDILVGRYFD
ncbi:hypothetical protein CWI42_081400 [Ordospora colligata]|uniref:Uncharacterized protein n=1 Tax=Ordospora colligata OC4 TaxID=1354746 RepID=A0A0B2UJJ6_9MICR|nr:uncharacterized protein M896_081400 [Ordospora colligata OC4]KHN69404.1 hypothetical protein M896_081400 [Ordospora colligata OC4]TBU14918.1 hypothetical protein CWI41_081390 [Ordospora colligata]TBU15049.1 hypothetical protein CWI40_081410 [Ordospora colligata]TBU18303.1 hypothetical protein CWI42_081400 [Ordospora colligata]